MTGRDVQTGTVTPGRGISPLASRTLDLESETAEIRLEPSYWDAIDDVCRREELTADELCSDLMDRLNQKMQRTVAMGAASMGATLANAMRVFIDGYYRQAATEAGHDRAGHGRGIPVIGVGRGTPFDAES